MFLPGSSFSWSSTVVSPLPNEEADGMRGPSRRGSTNGSATFGQTLWLLCRGVTVRMAAVVRESNGMSGPDSLQQWLKGSRTEMLRAIRLASSNDTLALNTTETVESLRSKHPSRPADRRDQAPPLSSHPDPCTPVILRRLVASFPCGSAGGLDVMRPQILKLIGHINGEAANRLVMSLCNFVDVVVAGEVPPCIRSTFFGANLFAFTKPGGGIRPIAVGLTLRRLVSKFVGHLTKDERSDSYATVQLGIGTKNGAEAAGHAARALLEAESSPGTVLLKIDFSNAFNSIRRDTLLETAYQRYPSVYNYTLAAYGDSSFLMFGDETLLSDEGVQQGDPDGPRLFGDTINSFIQSLQSRFNVWYLDDGNLADDYQIVLGDLRDVIEEGRKCGLIINPAKSELFFLGTESDKSCKRILGQFSEVCCGIQTPPLENLTVLGALIGASAIISCLGDKTAALRILASRLPLLDSHHAFYLLKHSFAIPRLTYSLRTAPCFDHPKLLEDYDSVLRSALKDVCNSTSMTLRGSRPVSRFVSVGLG